MLYVIVFTVVAENSLMQVGFFFFKVVFIETRSVHGQLFFFLSLQYTYDHVELTVNIH